MSNELFSFLSIHPFKLSNFIDINREILYESVTSNKGLLFSLQKQGLALYNTNDYENKSITSTVRRDKPIDVNDFICLNISEKIVHIKCNSDASLLLTIIERSGKNIFQIYDIKEINNQNIKLVYQSEGNDGIIFDVKWHPIDSSYLLICFENVLVLFKIDSSLQALNQLPNVLTCDWSPKGKQFVAIIKTQNAELFQLKQYDLSFVEKRTSDICNLKDIFKCQYDLLPLDLCWISSYNFIIGFHPICDSNDKYKIYTGIYSQKKKSLSLVPSLNSSSDCINSENAIPKSKLYSVLIPEWNFLLLINNTAENMTAYELDTNDNLVVISEYVLPIDGAVVGACCDFTSNCQLPPKWLGNKQSISNCPLVILSFSTGLHYGIYLVYPSKKLERNIPKMMIPINQNTNKTDSKPITNGQTQPNQFLSHSQSPSLFGSLEDCNQQSTGGLFGSNTSSQTKSLFGTTESNIQSPSNVQPGSLFGQSATNQSGGSNLFRQTSTSQSSGSNLFGQAVAGQTCGSSLFGQASTIQSSGSSLFGQNSTSQSSSLFGQTPTNQSSGGSLFEQTPTSQSSGGSLFGQTATSQSSGGSLFGQTPTSQLSGGNLFGQTATSQSSGGSLFGQMSTSQYSGGLFGSKKEASLFGSHATLTNSNTSSLFSSPVPTSVSSQTKPISSLFGSIPTPTTIVSHANSSLGSTTPQTSSSVVITSKTQVVQSPDKSQIITNTSVQKSSTPVLTTSSIVSTLNKTPTQTISNSSSPRSHLSSQIQSMRPTPNTMTFSENMPNTIPNISVSSSEIKLTQSKQDPKDIIPKSAMSKPPLTTQQNDIIPKAAMSKPPMTVQSNDIKNDKECSPEFTEKMLSETMNILALQIEELKKKVKHTINGVQKFSTSDIMNKDVSLMFHEIDNLTCEFNKLSESSALLLEESNDVSEELKLAIEFSHKCVTNLKSLQNHKKNSATPNFMLQRATKKLSNQYKQVQSSLDDLETSLEYFELNSHSKNHTNQKDDVTIENVLDILKSNARNIMIANSKVDILNRHLPNSSVKYSKSRIKSQSKVSTTVSDKEKELLKIMSKWSILETDSTKSINKTPAICQSSTKAIKIKSEPQTNALITSKYPVVNKEKIEIKSPNTVKITTPLIDKNSFTKLSPSKVEPAGDRNLKFGSNLTDATNSKSALPFGDSQTNFKSNPGLIAAENRRKQTIQKSHEEISSKLSQIKTEPTNFDNNLSPKLINSQSLNLSLQNAKINSVFDNSSPNFKNSDSKTSNLSSGTSNKPASSTISSFILQSTQDSKQSLNTPETNIKISEGSPKINTAPQNKKVDSFSELQKQDVNVKSTGSSISTNISESNTSLTQQNDNSTVKILTTTSKQIGLIGNQQTTNSQSAISPKPGGTTVTTHQSESAFVTTSPQTQKNGGLFGTPTKVSQQPGLFGTPTTISQQQGGLFGTPSTTISQQPGLFGTPTTISQKQGGLFGTPSPTGHQQSSLLGTTSPSTQKSGGLFGPASTAVSQQQGGLFGTQSATSPQQGGLFGTNSSSGQKSGNIFGTPSTSVTQQSQGLFGTISPSQKSGNIFATPSTLATQQSGGLFGTTSPSVQKSENMFGTSSNTASQQQGNLFQAGSQPIGGLFGTTSTVQQGGSLFGTSTSSNTDGIFGTPATTNLQTKSTSVFGSNPQTTSLFGNSTNASSSATSIFGTGATQSQVPTGSLFGTNTMTSQSSGSSIFSNTINQQSGSLFGSSTQNAAKNSLFGNNTSQQKSNLFNTSPQPGNLFSNQTASGSLFDNSSNQSTNNIFGNGSSNTTNDSSNLFSGNSFLGGLGNKPNPESATSNVFRSTNLFGTSNSSSSNTSNLFKPNTVSTCSSNTTTGSLFNTSSPQSQPNSLFGSAPTFGSGNSGSLFGTSGAGSFSTNTTSNIFGSSNTPNTGSLFGSNQNDQPSFTSLNMPNQNNQTSNLFGSPNSSSFTQRRM